MISVEKSDKNARIFQKIFEFEHVTYRSMRKALFDNGKILCATARELINKKPKHGKIYPLRLPVMKGLALRESTGRKYRSSAPGEAPAVVTGTLRKSVNFTVVGTKELWFGVDSRERYGGAKYAKYLEYADLISMTGEPYEQIKPRPFISASYKKNKAQMMQRFEQAIKEGIK